ncbi:sphingomyelin phosphodiesterase-like isoform X1 [Photinus pyralis]|nr:sphingomyelin phosphodiesterase-like isoform X1 [Photinus pyralis]
MNLLSGAFRSIPIYPTLGNHETHPVNAFSPSTITGRLSTQWVFDLMRTEWRKWLPSATQGTISEGGYYTVLVQPGFRIIALNSNVCFSYNWWLLYDDVDPYDQLRWLVLVLFKAERNNEIVHILSHVPTADGTCLQNWSREFFKIILRFSHIIAAQFNGHTHAKENIIYYEGNDLSNPINVAFNGGSLTPYSDFNPNYVVYDVNRLNFEVMDYEMWIYDISESNLHPNRPMRWFKLYSFTDAYKVDRITPHRMNELVQNMTRDCNLSNQYFRLKFRDAEVSTSKGCNRDCVTENVCYMVTPYYKHVDQCNLLKESLDINYNCNFQ